MLYMQTADKLMRTARWLESFEGGVDRLRKIILDDELGICEQLDASILQLISGYECEWTKVVNEPEQRKKFRKFANAVSYIPSAFRSQLTRTQPRTNPEVEQIQERGQQRPADWAKLYPAQKFSTSDMPTPKSEWKWRKLAILSASL